MFESLDDKILEQKAGEYDAFVVDPDKFLIAQRPLVTYDIETCVGVVLSSNNCSWWGLYHIHAVQFTHKQKSYQKSLNDFFWKYMGIAQSRKKEVTLLAVGGNYERIIDAGNNQFVTNQSSHNDIVLRMAKEFGFENREGFTGNPRMAKDVLIKSNDHVYIAEKPIQEYYHETPFMTTDQFLAQHRV